MPRRLVIYKRKLTAASLGTRVSVSHVCNQGHLIGVIASAERVGTRVCFACVRVDTREGPFVTRG